MTAIAIVSRYDELLAALEQRRLDLGLSHLEVDDRSGIQEGYYGHLVSWEKNHGKGLGPISMPLVLGALGLKLAVIEADQEPARRGAKWDVVSARRRLSSDPVRTVIKHWIKCEAGHRLQGNHTKCPKCGKPVAVFRSAVARRPAPLDYAGLDFADLAREWTRRNALSREEAAKIVGVNLKTWDGWVYSGASSPLQVRARFTMLEYDNSQSVSPSRVPEGA